MRLVDAAQMQYMDQYTISEIGLPGIVLMENAARSWVAAALPYLKKAKRIFVLCGSGNNGGDGYAIARILANQGFQVKAIAVKPPKSSDCIKNSDIWNYFGETESLSTIHSGKIQLDERDLLVDAILGTGIESNIRGELVSILNIVNQLPGTKISVDMPSGISASTGDLLGVGVKSDCCITFQKEKVGHHLNPGKAFTGQLICQKISIQEQFKENTPTYYSITEPLVKTLLRSRPDDSYKNMYGHLLTWCGTPGTLGASYLSSISGLQVGAGLVTMALPSGFEHTFLSKSPELMSCPQEALTLEKVQKFNALVLGCGLGRDSERWTEIQAILEKNELPIVLDADAFYGITDFSTINLKKAVLTPHLGEFFHMTGHPRPKTNKERLEQGVAFVKKYQTTLIMKGAPTIIFTASGEIYINTTGNSGMATAGSGDVLSGIIGGLLAQGMDSEEAAILGVWLHGKSGDLFRATQNEESLTATNLIDHIGSAITAIKG